MRTKRVEDIPSTLYPSEYDSFINYSYAFTLERTERLFTQWLSELSDLSDDRVVELVPLLADTVLAYFAGDRQITWNTFQAAFLLAASDDPNERLIGQLLLLVWNELPRQYVINKLLQPATDISQ